MSENENVDIDAAAASDAHKKYEGKKPAIVFFSIAIALFFACIGFLVWNTVRMRRFESDYVKIKGTVVDVESHSSNNIRNDFLVISYTFDGKEYTFTDREGGNYDSSDIGKYTEIYVDPQNPDHAQRVDSSGWISTFSACCFAFFCILYAVSMNIFIAHKGSSFKKRFLLVWGSELLLGITILLLLWSGTPHCGFGEVLVRNGGAIGVIVICGLVLLATLVDGIITIKIRSYMSKHR